VREGRFRADLLYRLNVFPLRVPALRERRSDIPLLIAFFLEAVAKKLGKPLAGFIRRDLDRLVRYGWPGNVRELQNVVERAAILARSQVLTLQADVLGEETAERAGGRGRDDEQEEQQERTLEAVERAHILRVLQETGGVVEGPRGAARVLGIHPATLRSRMKKLGVSARSNLAGPEFGRDMSRRP
jgi:formate hydrogenlyase transcriptional activator